MNLKYIFIITILLLLLFASFALNYIFYKKAFIPQQAAKLDPMGLNYYPSNGSLKADNNKQKVMFYGDSRGLSWTEPHINQYQFLNRSIGNQTSTQVLARFQKHVVPHHPDILIIQVCVNDLKLISFFPEQKKQIVADCKNNMQALLKQAHDIRTKVILTTIFPLGEVSLARKALGIREQVIMDAIDEVNSYIESLASDNTIIFDGYRLLKGKGRKINKQYSRDWLHLNDKGYQYLNTYLEVILP